MGSGFEGFFSYTRVDNEYTSGLVRNVHKYIEKEVQSQIGEHFRLFLDVDDIEPGVKWQRRIEEVVHSSIIFIPVLTPSFLKSAWCRKEFQQFLARESPGGYTSNMLPLKLTAIPRNMKLSDEEAVVLRDLEQRQLTDITEYRKSPRVTRGLSDALDAMVKRIVELYILADTASGAGTAVPPTSEAAPIDTISEPPVIEPPGPPTSTPMTVVVDAYGRGDYDDLALAVEAAAPGTRLTIRPGTYEGAVSVGKQLELVGDGLREEIILEASGTSVLIWTAKAGSVENVTIRQLGDGQWDAIDVADGEVEIHACDITSWGRAGVAIHSSRATLEGCHVHDCRQGPGVFISENGRGIVENNRITENRQSGIQVTGTTDLHVRGNLIHDNTEDGIFIYKNGNGTFADNEVTDNTSQGIEVAANSEPVLRGNTIARNKGNGLFVHDQGGGRVEENNDISENGACGIRVSDSAGLTVRRNQVRVNTEAGIFVHEKAKGTFEDNDIIGNGKSGVEVTGGAEPLFSNNTIAQNRGNGLYLHDDGRGTFKDNQIVENVNVGIMVGFGCKPVAGRNRVEGNGGAGLDIFGYGTYEDNVVVRNGHTGGSPGIEVLTLFPLPAPSSGGTIWTAMARRIS
jgi:F-box protein 11